jgi:hypothetical protein
MLDVLRMQTIQNLVSQSFVPHLTGAKALFESLVQQIRCI